MAHSSLPDSITIARNMQAQGRFADALVQWRDILHQEAAHPEALHMAGICCHQAGLTEDAIAYLRKARIYAPDDPYIGYNLALSLIAESALDEAANILSGIEAGMTGQAQYHLTAGSCHLQRNRLQEAEACFNNALALEPGLAEARYNRGIGRLLAGNWADAWPDWEYRWQSGQFTSPQRHFSCPQWTGGALTGKHLHIHAEQGLGDSLHMARYIPLLQDAEAISIEVKPPLVSLFRKAFPKHDIIAFGDPPSSVPDLHVPMMSLPGIFNTRPETVPAPFCPVPFQAKQKKELPVNVGLVWSGNANHPRDKARSIALSALKPLRDMEGVALYSFQTGQVARDARHGKWKQAITDLSPTLTDFTATSAALAKMDLLVTVDTAIAHLAAGMGLPTWMMISHHPDWRWMLSGKDTPWYPAMRLFRQPEAGNWSSVINNIRTDLSAITAARS